MKKSLIAVLFLIPSLKALADEPFIVEQDFASLFNRFRYAQPAQTPWAGSYFAYRNNGIGVGVIDGYGYKDQGDKSASYLYDQMYNGGENRAHDFEVKNHSCDNQPDSERAGCDGWWGHCNGWSAAAIKEIEPRATTQVRGQTLEVGHQKALLTELWLTANSAYLGETQKRRPTGSWVYDVNDPDYKTFWDVTPRQAVLAFMNEVGAKRTGVVIDRFTGEQVWNQPIVGYRILPIRNEDLGQENFNGKSFAFARVRMKLFWANDNVHPGHVSTGFSIDQTADSENDDTLGFDYDQRLLKFKLYFDAPVVLAEGGTKIQSAGNIVGEGVWEAQENPSGFRGELDQSHPDFIWLPQSAYIDFSRGYGNPYIGVNQIMEVAKAASSGTVATPPPTTTTTTTSTTAARATTTTATRPAVTTPPTGSSVLATKFEIDADRANIYDGDNALIAERLILRIFKRANLSLDVDEKNIQFSGSHIIFKAFSSDNISSSDIRQAFEDAGAKLLRIDPVQ